MRALRTKPVLCLAGFMSMALVAVACHPVPSDLVADYQFQNTRASSVGDVPQLTDINENGNNVFLTDTVDGVERRVLRFPLGNGLILQHTNRLPMARDRYSVVILFRFQDVPDYQRILQTKDDIGEEGLYAKDGALNYFGCCTDIVTGQPGKIPADTYVQVAVTRDDNGVIIGYVDGVPQLYFSDSENYGVVDGALSLRFFDDNTTFESAGRVARIRIWNRTLTSREVADLHRLG